MLRPHPFVVPLVGVLGLFFLCPSGEARDLTIGGDVADYGLAAGTPPTKVGTGTTMRIGSNSGGRNTVLVFAIPALQSGETINSASLSFYAAPVSTTTPTFNADLWGIGIKNSTTEILEYLGADSGDPDATNVKLRNDLLPPALAAGVVSTGANPALATYLQQFYAANPGYAGGSYVFLRLNHDAAATGNVGWSIDSASGTTRPFLTISTQSPPTPPGPSDNRPNFLFLISDDQRWDAMSVVQAEQGAAARFPWLHTPNMDRLAAQGVRFRNAFVSYSLCAPSRASFLTGKHSHINGITNNGTYFPLTAVTWATQLQGAGYRTGYIGKWHMADQMDRPGFNDYATFPHQGVYFNQAFTVRGITPPTTFTSTWVDDQSTDYALSFITTNKDRAWGMVVGFKAPHAGWQPPTRYTNLYAGQSLGAVPNLNSLPPFFDSPLNQYYPNGTAPQLGTISKYFGCIQGVDDNLGRILDKLDALNLTERTVVVYCGDNGYYLAEHKLNDKRVAYEEAMRIPLIVRYPRMIKQPAVRDEMVVNIDMLPTFMEIAGLPIPAGVQGQSWVPLLTGQPKPPNWRKGFLFQYSLDTLIKEIPDMLAYRTETAKFIFYPGREWWNEVFDLTTDRYETTNLAGNPAAATLQQNLQAAFRNELVATGLTPAPVSPSLSGSTFTTIFQGGMGLRFQFEKSSTLTTWSSVGSPVEFTLSAPTKTLTDTSSTGATNFYRARMIEDQNTQPGRPAP